MSLLEELGRHPWIVCDRDDDAAVLASLQNDDFTFSGGHTRPILLSPSSRHQYITAVRARTPFVVVVFGVWANADLVHAQRQDGGGGYIWNCRDWSHSSAGGRTEVKCERVSIYVPPTRRRQLFL